MMTISSRKQWLWRSPWWCWVVLVSCNTCQHRGRVNGAELSGFTASCSTWNRLGKSFPVMMMVMLTMLLMMVFKLFTWVGSNPDRRTQSKLWILRSVVLHHLSFKILSHWSWHRWWWWLCACLPRENRQRETGDLWHTWSEWWGDFTWPRERSFMKYPARVATFEIIWPMSWSPHWP